MEGLHKLGIPFGGVATIRIVVCGSMWWSPVENQMQKKMEAGLRRS